MATVLLVEDNQALRMIYKNQLIHDGYSILEAATIKEANNQLLNNPVDILLLDIMLPDKSGLSFLEEIRKDTRFASMPVLMLTSLPEEVALEKSKKLSIHGYLIKDQVTPGQIAERIKLALVETKSSNPQ